MSATLEDCKQENIDQWGSLNTAGSPMRIPIGQSPDNQNVWVDEKPGSVVTANGYTKLGTLPSNLPPTLIIDFFISGSGSQSVIISDGQNVYKTTDYVNFTTVKTGLSEFFQLRGLVIRDKLWLTNGSDSVMTYDGTTLTVLDGTGGTPNVPKGKYISYHDERVWLFGISGDPSSLRFSELTDSSGTEIAPDSASAWPSDNELQISEGDADIGTALFLYRGYLYATKAYSIWRITGYDVYTYTRTKTRSSTGTRFAESVRELDNQIIFIGVDGLYTFNGEESTRISDIIDPASSEEGIFAFRNLQQPLLNNQFWNVSSTTDFTAGTVMATLDTDDNKLALAPADDTQANFNAGTLTNCSADDNPGNLQLSLVTSGTNGTLLSSGKTASLVGTPGQSGVIGVGSYITDGNDNNRAGFAITADGTNVTWVVDLGTAYSVGRVIIKNFYFEANRTLSTSAFKIQSSSDNTNWTDRSTITPPSSSFTSSDGVFITGPHFYAGPTTFTQDFTTASARYWRLLITGNPTYYTITEMEVYQAGFRSSGKFVSKTIDYTVTPNTFGSLAASITTNGENYQFFTQSSADGSSWDAEVNLSNGAAIASTAKRYLRWGVYLYSSTGVYSPVIDKVYVGGTYFSEIHNTGGNIYRWSAFQMSQNKAGETITAYYRAAATSGGVSAASWTAIVPGAVPGAATTDVYIQIRLELSTTDADNVPYVDSFTVNWILANGNGVNTLQNVASITILNRYWLSAATLGADANDIVIIRGKATFGSPFMKKDFALLSFCRVQDYYIAGSSEDGSIYRLEYGYSKNGSDMDSYFETRDYSKDGFIIKGYEIIFNGDRTGPYTVSVGVSIDGGITYTEKTVDLTRATSTTNVGFTKKLNVSFMGDKYRLRVRLNGADKPFSIDSLTVFYRLMPARGSLN